MAWNKPSTWFKKPTPPPPTTPPPTQSKSPEQVFGSGAGQSTVSTPFGNQQTKLGQERASSGGSSGGGNSSSGGGTSTPTKTPEQVFGKGAGQSTVSTPLGTQTTKLGVERQQPKTISPGKTTTTSSQYVPPSKTTATNQITGGMISKADPDDNRYLQIGTGTAFLWSAKNLGFNIKQAFFSKAGEQQEYKSLSDPFNLSEKRKSDTTAYTTVKSGSISPDESAFNVVTYGNLQKDIELKRNIEVGGYKFQAERDINELRTTAQADINVGGDYESISADFNKKQAEISKSYQSNVAGSYSKYKDIPGVYEQKSLIPGAVGLATDIGVSFTPIAPAYFVGKGISYLASEQNKGRIIVDQSGGIIKEELTPKEWRGLSYIGFAGVSTFGKLRGVERSIVGGELEQLGTQKIKFLQVTKQSGEQGLVTMKGVQSSGGLSREFLITGKTYNVGGKGFIMPTGEGIATTKGTLGWNILGGKPSSQYLSIQTFKVGAKGVSFPLGESGKLFANVGTTTLLPGYETSALFKMPTTSAQSVKVESNVMKQFTKNLKYSKQPVIKELSGGISYKLKDNIFLSKNVKGDTGLNLIYNVPDKSSGIQVYRSGGTKTPFSETFGLPTSQVSTQTFQAPVTSFAESSIVQPSTSGVRGGLTTVTKTQVGQTSINLPKLNFELSLKQQPKTDMVQKGTLITGSLFGARNIFKTNTTQVSIPSLAQAQTTKQTTKLGQSLISPATFSTPTMGGIPGKPFGGVPFLFPFSAPVFGRMRTGDLKAKRTYRYTPSYKALVFGIKGPAPTKTKFTGLELRPIVGGSFFGSSKKKKELPLISSILKPKRKYKPRKKKK